MQDIRQLNWQLLCYTYFSFSVLCVLFSYRKKWLSYLSHAVSPNLHGKFELNEAFSLSFCWILNKLIIINFFILVFFIILHHVIFVLILTTRRFWQQEYYLINVWDSQSPLWVISRGFVGLFKILNIIIWLYIVVWLI